MFLLIDFIINKIAKFLSLPRNINRVSDLLFPYMPHFSRTPCATPTSDMRISNIHVHHL